MRCQYPRTVFVRSSGHAYTFPCGKCYCCRKTKQQRASFRIDAHRRFSNCRNCFFLTLTYASEFLPFSFDKVDYRTGELLEEVRSDEAILCPPDIVNFFKRFRRYSGDKCTYFYCGEYGDKFDRPHWHAILHTNMSYKEVLYFVRLAWSVSIPFTEKHKGTFITEGKYRTKRLSIGRLTVSAVNMRRIRYCAKYVVKDNNSEHVVPKYARWSKGYGIDWLKSSEAKELRKNPSLVTYTSDGNPVALPRYLSHRLYDKETYTKLVDEIVFSELPPDRIIGSPDIIRWTQDKDNMIKRQIWQSRINIFTPLSL